MLLSPVQLQSLMSPSALNCTQGWLCVELGWMGDNATRRVARLMNGSDEMPLTTAKHIIRIAAEHGFTLNSQGHWQSISTRGEGK